MARTIFEMGFAGSPFHRPLIGINLKDITSKVTSLIPGQAPVAPIPTLPPAPQNTILGVSPMVAALGGVGILGAIAAIAFGHR